MKHPALSAFSRASDLTAQPGGRSRIGAAPALPGAPSLNEMFGDARDGAPIGFTLAQLPSAGTVLWVQDRMSALETGAPYGPGLGAYGLVAARLVMACGRSAADVLWTMEEGLACPPLAAVLGEIWGNPRELDFTATKRLARRAERTGVHAFLIRWNAAATLSAARRRWRIASLPSAPHPHDMQAPGAPHWDAQLFRVRGGPPGRWQARYDAEAHRLDLAALLPGRTLDGPAEGADAAVRPLRTAAR